MSNFVKVSRMNFGHGCNTCDNCYEISMNPYVCCATTVQPDPICELSMPFVSSNAGVIDNNPLIPRSGRNK